MHLRTVNAGLMVKQQEELQRAVLILRPEKRLCPGTDGNSVPIKIPRCKNRTGCCAVLENHGAQHTPHLYPNQTAFAFLSSSQSKLNSTS